MMSSGKRILIFGGTGFVGSNLVEECLKRGMEVAVFSRDENKHFMFAKRFPTVRCIVGDVRNYDSVHRAIVSFRPNYVVNAAAMKQVPICEEFPLEATATNVNGQHNIVRAIENCGTVESSVIMSTDKACGSMSVYGMTKFLQERTQLEGVGSRFTCLRCGNIAGSTGSVIPFFNGRIRNGLPLTVTHEEMNRFLMSAQDVAKYLLLALESQETGVVFIPKVKSVYIQQLAEVMVKLSGKDVPVTITEMRPGEKLVEELVSIHELNRVQHYNDQLYVLQPKRVTPQQVFQPYVSDDDVMTKEEIEEFLLKNNLLSL